MKKVKRLSREEENISKKIASGKIKPVQIPRLGSAAEILKYQICSEIISYKKSADITQAELAASIGVHKSEISKIFSYQLGEFSSDRLLGMVELLIQVGADIKLEVVFNEAKMKIASFERKIRAAKKMARNS